MCKTVAENGSFSCVPFCLRSLRPFERCVMLLLLLHLFRGKTSDDVVSFLQEFCLRKKFLQVARNLARILHLNFFYLNLHNLFKNGTTFYENWIILSNLKGKCQKNSIFWQIHSLSMSFNKLWWFFWIYSIIFQILWVFPRVFWFSIKTK